jgi:hypothetical protein
LRAQAGSPSIAPVLQRIFEEDGAMFDLLYAFAQVLSLCALVAGFGLISWYAWMHNEDDRPDD